MENLDSLENTCLVCHEAIEIFAVGKCDHPICYKCSTRMRVICDQKYCPICRTVLPEVLFLTKAMKYDDIPLRNFIENKKMKILYEDDSIRKKFDSLLEHRCYLCKDRYPEKSFSALKDHMRSVHALYFCEICLELKIFTSERKVYNRHDLASHKQVGDKGDNSYKSHPLCKFCDVRYLDKDELYMHLRKEHYFCHFCESIGSQEFYIDYEELKTHFRTDHYLCEEDGCDQVQFVNAFRTDIDLKGHQANKHSKAQSKSEARQERKLNIDINLVPRPNSRARGTNDYGRRSQGLHNQDTHGGKFNLSNNDRPLINRDNVNLARASLSTMSEYIPKSDTKEMAPKSNVLIDCVPNTYNFPTLGSSQLPVASVLVSTVSYSKHDSVMQADTLSKDLLVNNRTCIEDFPLLKHSDEKCESPRNDVSNSAMVKSLHPQRFGTANTEDFPELPNAPKSKSVPCTWIKPNNVKVKEGKGKQKHVSVAAHHPSKVKDMSDWHSLNGVCNPQSNCTQCEHIQTNPLYISRSSVTSSDSAKHKKKMSKSKKEQIVVGEINKWDEKNVLLKEKLTLHEIANVISSGTENLDRSNKIKINSKENRSKNCNSSKDDASKLLFYSGSDWSDKSEKCTGTAVSKLEKKENRTEQMLASKSKGRIDEGVPMVKETFAEDEFPVFGYNKMDNKVSSGIQINNSIHEQRSEKTKEKEINEVLDEKAVYSGSDYFGKNKKCKTESNSEKKKSKTENLSFGDCAVKIENMTEWDNVNVKIKADENVFETDLNEIVSETVHFIITKDEFPDLEGEEKVNKKSLQGFGKHVLDAATQLQKPEDNKKANEMIKCKETKVSHKSNLSFNEIAISLLNGNKCLEISDKSRTKDKRENEVKITNDTVQKMAAHTVKGMEQKVPVPLETPCEIFPEMVRFNIIDDKFQDGTEFSTKKYPQGFKKKALQFSRQTPESNPNEEETNDKTVQKFKLSLDVIASAFAPGDIHFRTSKDTESKVEHRSSKDNVNIFSSKNKKHDDNKAEIFYKFNENNHLRKTEDAVQVLNGTALHKILMEPESVKLNFTEGAFPYARDMESGRKPPGFQQFGTYNQPPGFASQNTSTLLQNSSCKDNLVQMLAAATTSKFCQPINDVDRNANLILAIQSCCKGDAEKYANFRIVSGKFRRSEITAQCYYQKCEELLGKSNFAEICPELVALLPDIGKQKELLSAIIEMMNKGNGRLNIVDECKTLKVL